MSRSSSPRAVLPPTDHVARELLKRGARDPAMALLRAAVRRDPAERACAALIKALGARPDAAVSGPELVLDLTLIDGYVARGMLLEARAVLAGAGLDTAEPGAERARMLDELLAPIPPDAAPALLDAFRHLLTGGASLSLSLVEEYVQKGNPLPEWAARNHNVLRRILLDDARESTPSGIVDARSASIAGPAEDASTLSRAVASLIRERDLRGAVVRLDEHCAQAQADAPAAAAAAALGRLVRALDVRDGTGADVADTRTMPMGPQKVADLNLRMGNLLEAERLYRRVLLDEPDNVGLRAMLDDVQALRRFLDAPAGIAATPLAGVRRSLIDAAVAEIAVRPTEPLPVIDYMNGDDDAAELPRMYTDITGSSEPDTDEVSPPPSEPRPRALGNARPILSSDLARAAAASAQSSGTQHDRPSSPALSKRGPGPSSGAFGVVDGYGTAKSAPPSASNWDDDATGVLEPAVEAELLLKQGFAARALAAYEMLAERTPSDERLRRRVAEIKALIASERTPMPGDLTVRRDISNLQRIARPTGMQLDVSDDVRAAAVAMTAGHLPGTLDATGIPPGQFDDDDTTSVVHGRPAEAPRPLGARVAPAPSADLAVQITRIVIVR